VQVKCFYGVKITDRKRWNGSEKSMMMMIVKIVVMRITICQGFDGVYSGKKKPDNENFWGLGTKFDNTTAIILCTREKLSELISVLPIVCVPINIIL